MMKRITLTLLIAVVLLGFLFLFSACRGEKSKTKSPSGSSSIESTSLGETTNPGGQTVNTGESSNKKGSARIGEDGTGEIHFGLTLNEMKARFGTENMVPLGGGSTVYTFIDPETHISYVVKDDKLYQASFTDPGAATSKGLTVGDGYKKMVKLYGANYRTRTEEGLTYYVYDYPKAEFSVAFGEGTDEIILMDIFAK